MPQSAGDPVSDARSLVAAALVAAALVADAATPDADRDAAIRLALAKAWADQDLDAVALLASSYDELLLLEPRTVDGAITLVGVGNSERRHRGAFSTPPRYAAALARRALPTRYATSAASVTVSGAENSHGGRTRGAPTVVDPACGAGALLRAALARLLELGVTPADAATALHGVDADPVAVDLCRAVLAADLTRAGLPVRPADLAGRIRCGEALLGPAPSCPGGTGLVWHEAFPDVLDRDGAPPEPATGWRGGFDAVLANPPWERLKVHARDWGGVTPDVLRSSRAADAKSLRDAGRHPLTGAGELNAYLPFVETCWRLLAPDGRASLLVPAGIASDRSSARLLETLVRQGRLDRLQLIDPDGPVFTGVGTRLAVAIVDLAGGPLRDGVSPAARPAQVAVGLPGPDDENPSRAWPLDADLLRLANPNTHTPPLFGSPADARIGIAVHRRTPVLLRRNGSGDDGNSWQLRTVTPLHMTRDAVHFRTAPGDGLLPLWEAKHCDLLDPGGGRSTAPRYWVPETLVRQRFSALMARGWLAGYRNVSTSVAPRTLLPTPVPLAAVGNSLPLLDAPDLPLLLAALSSLPVDYLLRQKHAGANVNFFKLEQVPVPPPAAYEGIRARVLGLFARAVVWRPGLDGLAAELASSGITVPADDRPDVRAQARAELDALHAVLLGIDRTGLEHLLGTFAALRQKEVRREGRFVTAERVLAAFDRIA